jgi:Flp pilus assembly pilin Flp
MVQKYGLGGKFWEIPVKNVIKTSIDKFLRDDTGSAAVEYVVIAAALTTALIPGFYYVSSAVADKMTFISSFFFGT